MTFPDDAVSPTFTLLHSDNNQWFMLNRLWTNSNRTFTVGDIIEVLPSTVKCSLSHTQNRLIVLDDYRKFVADVYRIATESPLRGFIANGTPGIGKTMSLWYLLICLLQANETVLFTIDKETKLFHNGQVYACKQDDMRADQLPLPNGEILWSLIDMAYQFQGPAGTLTSLNVFPVQTTSIRYQKWLEHRGGDMCFMSLWTREQLLLGLKLCVYFPAFHQALEAYIHHQIMPKDKESNMSLAITVAKSILDRHKAFEADTDADDDTTNSDIEDVDKALGVLLDNAIDLYGFAPRDVHRAILFPRTVQIAQDNLKVETLTYDALKKICISLERPEPIPPQTSHLVMAIEPVWVSPLNPKDACSRNTLPPWFIVKFKSADIAQRAVSQMLRSSHQDTLDFFFDFCKRGSAVGLAGCAFEWLAHYALARGDIFNLIPMTETTDSVSSAPKFAADVSMPSVPVTFSPREMETIDLQASISELTLTEKTYYIPRARNNAPFDAFTIEYNSLGSTDATLWIFQMTISTTHRGSDEGYMLFQKLVKNLGNKNQKRVHVRYVLVCSPGSREDPPPTPTGTRHWKMPNKWDCDAEGINHRGDVFCLILPAKAMAPDSESAKKRKIGDLKQ